MVFPKARLVVSAFLFLAWIGFLAYLVAKTRDPVILSRPQLSVSSLVVLADVQEKEGRPSPTITVKKVLRALDSADDQWAGKQITVPGLPDCGPRQGWKGPEAYIIPLTKHQTESGSAYEVTPIPLSPGYYPEYVSVEILHVGPQKDKVAELANQILGGAGRNRDMASGTKFNNVRISAGEDFKRKADEAKATVRITDGESRIYRATPDALGQLEAWQK